MHSLVVAHLLIDGFCEQHHAGGPLGELLGHGILRDGWGLSGELVTPVMYLVPTSCLIFVRGGELVMCSLAA